MARHEVEELLAPCKGYNRCVVEHDVADSRRVASCMQTVSEEVFDSILSQAGAAGVPVLLVHESDGFGCNMCKTETAGAGGTAVARVCQYRAELLLELIIVKTYTPAGRFVQAIRFHAPRNMHGKSAWHIFRPVWSACPCSGLRQCVQI